MKRGEVTTIGRRYRLTREVGRGGMGAVWLAVDEVLGREVAIKRIGVFHGDGSPGLMRAQREARLAAQLNHPHVVAVFDFVTEGAEQWLVMEYVAGSDLAALTQQHGGLPATDAAKVLAQVAEALAIAHDAGILHRDVKPANILVNRYGNAKLADFGIARARADSTLTRAGMVSGSPSYLAPEVVAGERATEASDVWSLGATLFHTLTGRSPYDTSENALSTMYRVVNEEPPRLPGGGWPSALLETTMVRDPADRWPMARVRDYLASGPPRAADAPATAAATTAMAASGVEDGAVNDDKPVRSGAVAVLAVLVALAVMAAVGWWLLAGDPSTTARDPAGVTQSSRAAGSAQASPTSSRSASPSPSRTRPQQVSPAAQPSTSVQPSASVQASSLPSTSSSPAPSSSGGSGPATQMRSFVEQYVATALSDPAASWQQLTPRFQQTCCRGSLGNYAAYWNSIATASLADVRSDPGAMRVSYVITWDPVASGPEDEQVTLGLVQEGGRYFVDYEL